MSGRMLQIVAALSACLFNVCHAGESTWTGGDVGGSFHDDGNWSGGFPSTSQTAVFPSGSASTELTDAYAHWRLRVFGNATLQFVPPAPGSRSFPSYTLLSPTIDHSNESVVVRGSLTLQGDGDLFSTDADITGSPMASMTVSGDCRWINSGRMDVASTGMGMMSILDGGYVKSESAKIACCFGGSGSVLVSGGSEWVIITSFEVGDEGEAWLFIEDDGRVEADDLRLGSDGATDGHLLATSGGELATVTTTIGGDPQATGTATISGSNSRWFQTGDAFLIGTGGTAEVTVDQSAFLLSVSATVGAVGSASGTVTITDPGSTWQNLHDLVVGWGADGTVNVWNGGTLSNTSAILGELAGASGHVSIDGDGSTWSCFSEVIVGGLGVGTLDITGGATAYAVTAYIGAYPGSDGSAVIVDGPGSGWAVLDTVRVGNFGDGSLTVSDGAVVDTPLVTIAASGTVSGDGLLAANVVNGGEVGPGLSTGTLGVSGGYDQTSTGVLRIELGGGGHDTLAVGGNAVLGGTLEVTLSGVPSPGATLVIVSAAAIDGCFDTIVAPPGFEVDCTFDEVTVSVPNATACPGDTNDDAVVNVNDLNNVILDWGTDGTANGGDVTGPVPGSPPDAIVNVNDLNAVIVNWGACR